MEPVIYVLATILFVLALILYTQAKNSKKAEQEHQRVSNLQQEMISVLKRDKTELQEQNDNYAKDISELREAIKKAEKEISFAKEQIDIYLHEISNLKDALSEAERERDFYKNITEDSGKLNVPSEPASIDTDGSQLDPEQAAICDRIENSAQNFFITGKAGTGKSFLLSAFRKQTQKEHIVLAPTGIAALNVYGVTLHSAFGYSNLATLDVDAISERTIRLKTEKRIVLKRVSTIIIDEISMVRADTFDKIDRILRIVNRNNLPFGGKQMILFGDLFQLPPVAQREEHKYLYDRYGGEYFFCSDAYKQANFQFCELTINHRQKEDADYFELLNRVRDGSVTDDDIKLLNTRVAHDTSVYDRYTALLPTKAEVEHVNRDRMNQISSAEYAYKARLGKCKYPDANHSLETLFPILKTLRLKKGALVMMVTNDIESRWVNGTLGIVSELSPEHISVAINKRVYDIQLAEFSEIEIIYENGKLIYDPILVVEQYPVIPAYAITIHKSQGQTYQNIVCDVDRCFADGQAYVALSRCASLNGLHLKHPVTRADIRVNRQVLDFYYSNLAHDVPDSDTK